MTFRNRNQMQMGKLTERGIIQFSYSYLGLCPFIPFFQIRTAERVCMRIKGEINQPLCSHSPNEGCGEMEKSFRIVGVVSL